MLTFREKLLAFMAGFTMSLIIFTAPIVMVTAAFFKVQEVVGQRSMTALKPSDALAPTAAIVPKEN